MRSLRSSVWLCCLATTGCATGLATQAGGWVEVRTNYVRLRTDLDGAEAVELATDLQRHRDALVDAMFDCGITEGAPVAITLFFKDADYDTVAPRDTFKIVQSPKTGLVELPPELLMNPSRYRRVLRQAFVHEAVHALSAQCHPQRPPRLNEGLALFYETTDLDGGTLVARRQKYAVVGSEDLPWELGHSRQEITLVPDVVVPALDELVAFDFDAFYQHTGYYDTLRQPEMRSLLGRYAGAWALTHALETAEVSTHARLQQLTHEVRFGETSLVQA